VWPQAQNGKVHLSAAQLSMQQNLVVERSKNERLELRLAALLRNRFGRSSDRR